jgi:hypothetical protein
MDVAGDVPQTDLFAQIQTVLNISDGRWPKSMKRLEFQAVWFANTFSGFTSSKNPNPNFMVRTLQSIKVQRCGPRIPNCQSPGFSGSSLHGHIFGKFVRLQQGFGAGCFTLERCRQVVCQPPLHNNPIAISQVGTL